MSYGIPTSLLLADDKNGGAVKNEYIQQSIEMLKKESIFNYGKAKILSPPWCRHATAFTSTDSSTPQSCKADHATYSRKARFDAAVHDDDDA